MENNTTNTTPTPTTSAPAPGTEAPKKSNTGAIIAIVLIAIFVVVVLPCIFIGMIFFGAFKIADSIGSEVIEQIGQEIERNESENYVAGVWNCAKGTGSENDRDNFYTTIELNGDLTFQYGPYGDLAKNHYKGIYTFEDEEKKNESGDYSYYMIHFKTDEFLLDGVKQTENDKLSDMEIGITKVADGKQAITIFTSSYNMYYCYDY